MNNPYYADRVITPEIVEAAEIETDLPIQNSDPFADKTPVDPDLIVEIPMGGTIASAGPVNGPIADEIPLFETIDQEIPMGGTVAPVGPMDETIVHEAPISETVPYNAPAGEFLANESGASEAMPYLDPLDQKLSREAPVLLASDLSEPSAAETLYSEESDQLLTTMNENLGKLTD